MKSYIDRSKFTTELGRQLYDKLQPISPHEDWLYLMFMLTKGDERKQIVMDYINNGDRSWAEIDNFIIERWG